MSRNVMTVVAVLVCSATAWAQFPQPNGGTGGIPGANGGTSGGYVPTPPGGVSGEKNKNKVELEGETIVARYFSSPKNLKGTLERLKGVGGVAIDEEKKRLEINYTGSYDGIQNLTAAAGNVGVSIQIISHARMTANFKPQPGGTPLTLENDLNKVTKKIRYNPQALYAEMFIDLDKTTFDDLKNAAGYSKMDIKLGSHEWVSLRIEAGDAVLLQNELLGAKNVLVMASGNDQIDLWSVKKVKDEIFQKAAEKTEVKLGTITRQ